MCVYCAFLLVVLLCAHVFTCVCVPLDDILIFVNFRLEATVSHSPTVKGKNKRHTCSGAHSRAHAHRE